MFLLKMRQTPDAVCASLNPLFMPFILQSVTSPRTAWIEFWRIFVQLNKATTLGEIFIGRPKTFVIFYFLKDNIEWWSFVSIFHMHLIIFSMWWWWFSCSVVSDYCDHMDCSLPDFSVHGILQARIPEWVAISFSTFVIFLNLPLKSNLCQRTLYRSCFHHEGAAILVC